MRRAALILVLAGIGGCAGIQSALAPLGPQSERIASLWWFMAAGGLAILALVCLLTALALFGGGGPRRRLSSEGLVIGLGIILPIALLTILLFYGFSMLGGGGSATSAAALKATIVGEQWWWRVVYQHEDGSRTESANELVIPAGDDVALALQSDNVIHSFWIPSYAGKVDMIPGRINSIHFKAAEPGIVRGQCAEYCGGAHALMAFYAIALPPAEFEAWLAKEREDATPSDSLGARLFQQSGCGACHTIRGTEAKGRIGPDLTHVGGRHSLGAGILPNDEEAFRLWIARHKEIKPDNLMPRFEIHSDAEIAAIAEYLAGLQ